ncbi:MAG: (d)CMP kinase [Thermoleophilia bacterium]|nr:(d)CMP kinase [Thermoleophilia bacterium]
MIIAIDGPAGAGKSTVARAVARALGIGYLDTGAMYRALTLVALRTGVALDDGPALADMARDHPVTLTSGAAGVRVVIRGDDVTMAIRESDVTAAVSVVAAYPDVRSEMVARQRQVMEHGDWVCDGRDIGSVVFPGAQVKVFLTASVDERARRRHAELVARGERVDLRVVRDDVERRDLADSSRAASPLVVADGAEVLDTTGMRIDEVVARIAGMARGVS